MNQPSYIAWRDAKMTELLSKQSYDFEDLCNVMTILRSEQGCPWDREQDHHSIRTSLIEEAYEVIEAIDTDNPILLQEELGDLLFQIVFHAALEQEKQVFDMGDVINDITAKMIHRHPHVFASVKVENSTEVLSNWEKIKTEEKQRNTLADRLRAIPPMLPALMRAAKVGKKAEIDADSDCTQILESLEAQIAAVKATDSVVTQAQIGALLMGVTNLSRKAGVDPEEALSKEVDAIIDRVASES